MKIITDNIQEAIPNIPVRIHNCLIRNGCANYEKFADMTDYDLAMMKYGASIKEMICYRNKARYYRDFRKQQKAEYEKALAECGE